MYEPDAFIVPGFNPGMPTINRPPIGLTDQEILCVIAYLQSLGGTPTVTLQTSHPYYSRRRPRRRGTGRGAAGWRAADQNAAPGEQQPLAAPPAEKAAPAGNRRSLRPPRRLPPPRHRSGDTMNILVVLAVAVVFGLLRFRRANLLLWAVAWWVGIYVLLRFGFTAPIPASVISIYMGIVSLAILAYVSSSQDAAKKSPARSSGS